ncbi:hypothetical protein NGRA_2977 [Nosema granulosis]|uniref:Uncharacterized protein n=1 Tax=Nosema granulosis TaxID=83296 RepID=A0A9P6GW47_9MICR|nr:hypothetical protein NGRA_2977 [Nosema granulosis]
MSKKDDTRCNCEKIFQQQDLNCCCDKKVRGCVCENKDYKCCLKSAPGRCCENDSEVQCSDKECVCTKEEESRVSCSIRRECDDLERCCCEKNGRQKCCCSSTQEASCCCIVSGQDECCCVHEKDREKESEIERSISHVIERTQVADETQVSAHAAKQVEENLSYYSSSAYAKTSDNNVSKKSDILKDNNQSKDGSTSLSISSCESSYMDYSEPTGAIPSDLESSSILTSTCIASTKHQSEFKKVDEELINELKGLKKNSLAQESYDVYIVNDQGRVNSFELKHFINEEKDKAHQSNQKEVLLNKQVHGICIKNKQSEMSSNYQGKMKSILEKIKQRNNNTALKPNEPTILEITEFSQSNKAEDVVKSVLGKDVSSCRCNGRNSILCECSISKVEIIEASPINFTDLKTFSCGADVLQSEIEKSSTSGCMSNSTKSIIAEANESDIYDQQTDSWVENGDANKMYYSINSSSEGVLGSSEGVLGSSEDLGSSEGVLGSSEELPVPEEKVQSSTQAMDSPFDQDMKNKIEDLLVTNGNQNAPSVETININIGGNAVVDQGLAVTQLKMSINGDAMDEPTETENDRERQLVKNFIMNLESNSNKDSRTVNGFETQKNISLSGRSISSSILESSRIELERLKKVEPKQETTKIEEKIGLFGAKIGNVIKSMFEKKEASSSEETFSNSTHSITSASSTVNSSDLRMEEEAYSKNRVSERKSENVPKCNDSTSKSELLNIKQTEKSPVNRTFLSYEESKKSSDTITRSTSAVSCLAKTRKTGNTIEIALHLTNNQNEEDSSTITFIEQNNTELSSCLMKNKRNNKVGKLIEYFEELEKKK